MLYEHQKQIIEKNPKYHLLAWEAGVGKTAPAILLAEQNSRKILIVCPKSLKENWHREIKTWADRQNIWTVITKEQFRRDWQKLTRPRLDGLIIDEIHHLASYKSQLYKNTIKYLKETEPDCLYGLTATPYLSTPFNIFCYEKILGRQPSWMDYRIKYFTQIKMGSAIIPKIKPEAKSELAKIIRSLGSVVKKEDCLDLPDQIYLREDFSLTIEQRSAIKNLDNDPLIANHIVYWTKQHQICGGTLKDQFKKINSGKLRRIKEYAEEHKKFIIVCRYNAELEMIKQELGDRTEVFNGATTDRQELIDRMNDSKFGILLINSAISEGYNLTGFDMMIFYSNGFSYKDRYQIEGRIHRIGQTKKCRYIDFVVGGNIDEDVLRALKNKEDFQIEIYEKQYDY